MNFKRGHRHSRTSGKGCKQGAGTETHLWRMRTGFGKLRAEICAKDDERAGPHIYESPKPPRYRGSPDDILEMRRDRLDELDDAGRDVLDRLRDARPLDADFARIIHREFWNLF